MLSTSFVCFLRPRVCLLSSFFCCLPLLIFILLSFLSLHLSLRVQHCRATVLLAFSSSSGSVASAGIADGIIVCDTHGTLSSAAELSQALTLGQKASRIIEAGLRKTIEKTLQAQTLLLIE